MPRVCHFSGAKTSSGNTLKIRGKAKYLGGVGLKTTSVKKRTFKPNLQTVDTVEDGTVKRVKASVRAIRSSGAGVMSSSDVIRRWSVRSAGVMYSTCRPPAAGVW